MKRSVRNTIVGLVTALGASFCMGVGFASWAIAKTEYSLSDWRINADNEMDYYFQETDVLSDLEFDSFGFYSGKGFVGEDGIFGSSCLLHGRVTLNSIACLDVINSLSDSGTLDLGVSINMTFPNGKTHSDYSAVLGGINTYINSAASPSATDSSEISSENSPEWTLHLSSLPLANSVSLTFSIGLKWNSTAGLSSFPDFSGVGFELTITPKEAS